ncbi:rhombosortase [Rheinheimera sp. MMS21-TC3]|uniref:rhombosortase n=1 Tax=Rheinheimera sp. MMS21-TC3 TaxID=3072790 RepID=UPI0028C49133|nr:rhombosortase [Rheinheimera sp. MMS21-TC3]WNO60743.1 rhombosortase [Rheinheimera sp. MMS21-TC3]
MFTLSAWLQQNRRSKTWLGFAFITIISCVAIMLPEQIQQLFFYQYSAIEQAEYWRLLTGHLMHSNNWHLVMNLAGLGLVYLLHGRYYTAWSIILYVGCTALGISYLLLFFAPEIKVYVGLSGVLHALLCIGAFKDIQHKEPTGKILFFGLIAKVGYEQWQGPDADLAQLINANVAIDAHLYGVISGFILAFMLSSTAFIQALKTATKPK